MTTSSTAAARFALTLTAALLALAPAPRAAADPTTVLDSGQALTVSGSRWEIAANTVYSSTYTATPNGTTVTGTWSATQSLTIGDTGAASLTVAGNGTLATIGRVVLGERAGSSGTLAIDSGGIWNFTPSAYASVHGGTTTGNVAFEIGSGGDGLMTIAAGGTANGTGQITLGARAGASGTLVVDGYLRTNSDLQLGGYHYNNGPAGGTGANGTVIVGGTLVTGNIRVSYGSTQSTGTMLVNPGGFVQSAYLYVGHWGQGYYHLAAGGTHVITTNFILGQGDDTANRTAAVGTALVEGYVSATTNMNVGGYGHALLTVASGGVIKLGTYFNIASTASSSSGTVNVYGRIEAGTVTNIGNSGTGYLYIAPTGTVTSIQNISIGTNATATGIAIVAGLLTSNSILFVGNNGAKGTLTIEESGTVRTTNTVGNSLVGNTAAGSGSITVAGLFQAANRYHIGNNGGTGYLEVKRSGTAITGIMCVGYSAASVAVATSYATSGTVFVRDGGHLQTAYLQIGQWGQGYLEIEPDATVISTDYFITGGGDDTRAGGTAYGYTKVEGQLTVTGLFTVGNQTDSIGVLDVTEAGVVRAGGQFRIAYVAGSGANLAGTGTANIAGRLSAASALISNGGGNGTLNILSTGSVSFSGNYDQRAAATLGITLDPARATPYLEIGGAAALGGTLNVTGFTGTISGPITKASQIPTDSNLIIRSAGGFSGDFGAVNNIGGATGLPSYVSFTGLVYNDTDYRVGYILAGSIDLAAGETFEIDVPLRDVPSSTKWDGKSLIKTGAGTLVYSATTTRHTGVTLVEDGVLQITSPVALTAFRGDLINNSVIDLTTPVAAGQGIPLALAPAAAAGGVSAATADTADGHRILRAARIFGRGTFRMAVNTATGAADRLEVVGDSSLLVPATIAGAHQLLLTETRADGATATDADLAALTLVRVPAAADIKKATLIADLDWDDGSVIYPVHFAPDGAGTLGDAAPSTTSEAALAITAAQNLMWAGQQDNLARRLGDLRAQPASTGLWARAYATSVTLDPADAGDVRLDLYGLTVGADFSWKALNGNLHAGLYAGYGRATQDFSSTADGESTLVAGGLYAAWLHDAGWFANATLGYARLQNEFTAADAEGLTTADHDDTALALSLEFGRRLDFARGWFAEPSARLSLTRLDQSDYTTTGAHALPVSAAAATIYRARAGALAGRILTFTNDSTLQLHARLGGLYEGSTGGETAIGALTRRPNLDGPRAEAGLGLLWRQSAANQFYFDYDAAYGENYEQPWSLTLGFRHTF
jgi:outer membrane autotransporter protein